MVDRQPPPPTSTSSHSLSPQEWEQLLEDFSPSSSPSRRDRWLHLPLLDLAVSSLPRRDLPSHLKPVLLSLIDDHLLPPPSPRSLPVLLAAFLSFPADHPLRDHLLTTVVSAFASPPPSPPSSPRPAPAARLEKGTARSPTGSSPTSRTTGSRPSPASTRQAKHACSSLVLISFTQASKRMAFTQADTKCMQVPCALFVIFPAAFMAFLGPKALNEAHPRTAPEDFTVPPPWIPAPYSIAFRRHEAEWIAQAACQPNASGVSDIERFWKTLEPSRLFVSRCSREVDGQLCSLVGDLYGKPFLPSGVLAPYDAARAASSSEAGGDDDEETAGLMRWLDAQPERSVLYVAFGSEAPLTPEQLGAVALGLELAGVRFVWALRKPIGEDKQPQLPDGFERRGQEEGEK